MSNKLRVSDVASASNMQLWQSYCNKKMECELLTDQITQLEKDKAELVEALEDIQLCLIPESSNVFTEVSKLLTKHKGDK